MAREVACFAESPHSVTDFTASSWTSRVNSRGEAHTVLGRC